MAKSVTLSTGKAFPTVTTAKEYFAEILAGNEFADIQATYLAYCAKTDWLLPSAPASFYPIHDRGPSYTTRCFGVTFEDGTTGNFSMDKALRAIAA